MNVRNAPRSHFGASTCCFLTRFTHNFQETRAFHGNLLSEMRNARGLEPQCVVLYVFSAKLFKAEVLQRRFENPLTTQKTKIEHFNVGRVF